MYTPGHQRPRPNYGLAPYQLQQWPEHSPATGDWNYAEATPARPDMFRGDPPEVSEEVAAYVRGLESARAADREEIGLVLGVGVPLDPELALAAEAMTRKIIEDRVATSEEAGGEVISRPPSCGTNIPVIRVLAGGALMLPSRSRER